MITHKVSKTSVKASLLKIRRLALALGLFFIVQAGWGETYYWIGGGADNNWSTLENWSTTEGAEPGTGTACPGAADEVHIYGDVEVTIDDDISISTLLIEAGNAHFLNSSFTTTLSGTGSLTITDTGAAAINLTRCSSTAGVIGTLAINLPVTCDGTIQTHSGTTLSVVSGLTAANLIHSAGNGVPVSKIQVNGTLNLGTGTLNLSGNGNPGANQLVVESGGSVKAGTIEFGQTAYQNTGISNPIINNGTIEVSSSFTIPNFTSGVTTPYSGNGTIELNGTNATFSNNDDVDITITTLKGDQSSVVSGGSHTTIVTADFDAAVELNGTIITTADFAGAAQLGNTTSNTIENATFHDDITLSGANAFTSVTATALGDHTLTVNAVQTIQDGGSVSLSGTDNSSRLTVTGNGTGNFALGSVILNGNYLTLDTTSNVVTNLNGTAFAQNTITSGGGSSNWIVTAAAEHVWNGASGSWHEDANWLPPTVPGTTEDVIIHNGNPQISSDVTVNSITINNSSAVHVADSASLILASGCELDEKISGTGKLVLETGQTYAISSNKTLNINIENNGTLNAAADATFSKNFENNGTATFNGVTTISGNLVNKSSASLTGAVSVAGSVTDNGGITSAITLAGTEAHTFTGKGDATNYSIILNDSGSTTFKDSITLTSLTESSYSGSIIFSGTGDQTIPAGNYSSITVNKTSGNFIADGNTTITTFTQTAGDVVFNGDLNVKNYNHTNGAITLEGNTTFTDGSSYTAADFGSAVLSISGGTAGSPKTITATSFAAGSIICTDGASVGAATSYLDIEASGGITITNDIGGSSNYYKKVVLNAGSSDISIGGNIYTSEITVGCKDVEFSNKIFVGSVTIAATGAVSINSLEAQSLTINSGSPIKMAGTIKLNGSNDFIINYPLLLSNDTEFDVAGKIIIQDSGIIKSDSSAGKNLTLTASSIQLDNENPLGDNTTGKLATITINSPITLNSDSAIYSTETVFEGSGAKTVTGNHVLTQNGNLEIPASKEWTFNNQFVVNGNLTNSGTASFSDDIDVNGNITNSGNSTFDDVNVIGNVTDTGAWTQTTGVLTFDGSGTDAQIFTPKTGTSYANITLNKSAGSFETDASNALTAGSFTITACPSTRFKGEITFDSFGNSVSTTETISFGKNATINSAATFNRPVTISGAATIQTTSGGQTYKESVTVNANAKFKAPAGQTITFEKTLSGDGSKDLTIDTANSVFNDAVSGIQNLTTEGTVTVNSITVTAKTVTFKNDVSGTGLVINADDVVVDTAGAAAINTSGNQTYNARLTLNKATTFTAPQVSFNGNVSNSGAAALIVAGEAFINTAEIATTGATQTYNGNVIVQQNTTLTASQINYSNDINGTGKILTINASELNSTKTGSAGALTVASLNLTHSVGLTSHATGGITLNVDNITKTNGSAFTLTNNAALTVSDGIIINSDFINGATGTFSASSGTTIFKGNLNLSAGTFVHSSGTVKLTGENAVLDGGGKAFNNLVIENSVTIKGSNSFVNLTAENLGGKTIKFEAGATQTVSTLLKLQGTSATSMLNLRSTTDNSAWIIKCTADSTTSHNIQFADVKDGNNISDSGTPPAVETYNLFAMSSKDSGNNAKWNFPGMSYTWKGSSDATDGQKWYIAANWTPSSIPGKGSNVTIPADTDANLIKKLVLEDDVDITYGAADQGIITVNGTFDMADKNLTATEIVNKGLVKLVGKTNQIQGTMSNGISSTVEYYGSGFGSFAWDGDGTASGKQYQNLIISDEITWVGTNQPDTEALEVLGLTTISAGSGKSVTLNNAANVFTGNVKAGDSNPSATVNAGAVTLKASSIITLTNNANADSLELQSAVKLQNVTTSGNQTYEGTVEIISGAATIKSTGGNISFGNAATINGGQSLSLSSDGGTTFGANVGDSTPLSALTVTGPLTVNCGIMNTSGNQTYKGAVTLGAASSITSTAGDIDFSAAITGSAKLTTAGSGTAHFNNTVNVASLETQAVNINCASITTSGTQTYNGAVTLSKTGNITLTAKNSSDEYQTVQFNQNVSSATSVTPNLILDANTNISCSSVTVTGTQTYNRNVQIDTAATIKASEIDFAKDISGSGKKLTINSPIFKSTIASGSAEITLSELSFVQTSTLLETTNNTNINLNVQNIKGAGKTIVIDETLKNITLTQTAVTVEPTVQTETNSKLTASSGTTTFNADVTLANGTLDANGGTIILTGSGSTLSGNNTFKNLLAQNSLIINGSNTIANFTAGTSTTGLGGKTITFGANTTQEVTGKLTLRGTANTDRLNLRSSSPTTTSAAGTQWEINCTGSNAHDIEFVDIQDSNNSTSSYYLFALNSIDHGNNTKWNFPGMQYKWTGADSTEPTNWNVAANWEYLSIPGKGADIEIPAGCTNYPTLVADLDLNETYNSTSYKGKITVAANAQFDLAGQNLTLGEITNNGLVRLFGTQTIAATMSNGTDSSVEYYDSDPAAILTSFVWDGDGNSEAGKKYYNLIINKNVTQATATGEQLKVSGTTTISAGSGKTVTLNNASNVFTGHVIIGNSAAAPQVNAGAVILNGCGASSSAIYLENNILADSLTLNSNVQGGELTITAPLTINTAAVTSTGNQTYKSPVTLSHDVNFTAASGKLIKFEDTVSGSGGEKLTTSTGNSQFDGNVSNLDSLITDATVTLNADLSIGSITSQAVNINTASITTSGLQTYNGAVTLGADTTLMSTGNNIALNTTLNGAHTITFSVPDNTTNTITVVEKVGGDSSIATPPSITIAQAGTVTFKETVKANALTLTKANSTTFEKAVDITSFADDATEHTGTVTFAAGGIIQNDVTFNTDNIVTFTDTMDIGTDASRKNLVHTAGETKTVGTINAATTQLGNLTLTGDTTITTSGTQTYNGTINDATAGAHTLTLNSGTSQITFASDVGQTTAPKILTVNGPLAINCAAVTTSDQQNYNAAITSTGAITLKSAALNLNCSTVTTASDQTYDGPVNLLSDTSLTLNTGDLLLKSPLAGAHKFTIAKTNDATFDDTVTVTDFEITLANDTQFANPVAVTNFAITSANDTLFADTLTADSFAISQAANTIFNGPVTISSFTDAASAGNISFNAGGTISAATGTSFLTTDTVTFGDNQSDIMTFGSASPYEDITHTAGNTSITGLLNAANITLAQTAAGPMTIANSGLFKTIDGAALTYTTSFAQTGTGNSVIGGSFTGNGNASFVTNVQISGTAPADFGSSGTAVSITKNLIILRNTSDDLNINSRVNVTENLVLYKGPVLANADITAGKDILVLGSTYSTSDTSTGITNEYAYACVRPVTWSQPNYTETLLPDATPVPELVEGPLNDFTATLSVASGTTISAAKNFYANGTTLQTAGTTGQWTLKLPDLTNAASAFAEAYYSEISGCKVICNDGSSTDGTKSRLVCLECDDTGTTNTPNTNVDFDDFEITAAYTERDNAIRVEFNRPFRFNSYTVDLLKFHDSSDAVSADTNFTGLYADPDCQTPIEIGDNAYDYFYIKAAPQDSAETGAWNTDATGKTSGASDGQSTDRNGKHHTALPCLDFPRALQASASGQTYTVPFILTDVWGKRLNNYSRRVTKGSTAEAAYGSANSSNDLLDKTGPVLWKVRTGQELHNAYDTSTGQASEHSYDAHNFIEFLYSEKVDFDGDETTNAPLNADPATAENVKVTGSFGALQNSNIEIAGALNFAGLGTIQNGLLWTGSAGVTSKEVNALYRKGTKAEYSIRLSIAGYTEGTVTDPDGNTYKKWIGYIEKAQMPTGTVTHIADSNTFVKDKEGNPQIKYEALNMIPEVDSTEDGLYGKWDLSEPVFAPVRQNKKTAWASQLFQKNYQAEAVGNNSGVGSTLDRIEFHLYDNTPDFDDDGNAVTGTPEWFSEVGWCALGSDGEKATDLYKAYTYAADIFGGARPFDSNTQRRTQGGIRYSTLHSAVNAFKYGINSGLSESNIKTSFDNSKNTWGGASSLIFTGSSSPRRSAGDLEGLYFALPLANTSLDIKTSFTIKYDEKTGFVTDLAGNRLRTKIISTIDRTPPSIDMTVCPVGGDDLQIIFVKELCTDSRDLNYIDGSGTKVEITEDFESLITECIDFIKIDSSGSPTVVSNLKIDNTSPAVIEFEENKNGSFFTKIKFKLNRKVTLEDVKNTFIRIIYTQKYGEYSVDLFTGHSGSRVTFIQDENGNNIQMYTAHALSDFAVGVIDPLYAYDSAMIEEDGTIISDSLWHQNLTEDVDSTSWSVHDWNRDQKNYGTLPAKRPLAIVADTTDGTLENTDAPASFRLYLSNNPDKDSVSTQYNKDLEPDTQWRIWLPNEMSGVFTSLSEKNNTNYSQVDGTLLSDDISNRLIFDINDTITKQWAAGNQISFLFGLTNSDGSPVTIMHSPELDINNDKQYLPTSAKMPLFALRQTEPTDLLSLDLWSFRLKDVVSQRGGVTILNNVINSSQREKVVVKVNQPKQGNLTVLVMTLDGSIVDYLHRGSSEAGEHFYSWDGTNRRGHSVARGMYFIRVTGPGIDETRKVMVVKD